MDASTSEEMDMEDCPIQKDNAKSAVFIHASDGMSKVVSSYLSDLPPDEVKAIIEHEHEAPNGQFLTPLLAAAKQGHNVVVKLLVNKFGADLEHKGCIVLDSYYISGATPLWCAAGGGHLNVVKTLVAAGANVNHTTDSYSTPLRAACFDGRLDIVRYLVRHGADINIVNRYNNTCLMIAAYKGHNEIVKYLIDLEMDINAQARCGATALLFAAQCGHLEVVATLISRGAKHLPTDRGLTPLLAAAEQVQWVIVEYFLAVWEMSIEEHIDALELLGASFANDKENYNLALVNEYFRKAMELRYSNPDKPILKKLLPPVPAYDNWQECMNFTDLESLRFNSHGLHMEALTIRERILGTSNVDILQPIVYRGAVLADQGHFDKCLKLWLHGLRLAQSNKFSIVKDLLRFSQIFCQMMRIGIELDTNVLQKVLNAAVVELDFSKTKLKDSRTTEDKQQASDDVEKVVVRSLYLTSIAARLMIGRPAEDVLVIEKLIFQLCNIKATTLTGKTLLHLAVNFSTSPETFQASDMKFPCVDTVKILLKCGANVNALDNKRNTPLHYIARFKVVRDFETIQTIIRDLVSAGAHVDMVNNLGMTPMEAAKDGITKFFLQRYHKINLKCIAARAVTKWRIAYKGQVPVNLVSFIDMHGADKSS